MKPKRSEEIKLDDLPISLRRRAGRTIWTARITILKPNIDSERNFQDGHRVERSTGETDIDKATSKARQIYAELTVRRERGESLHPKSFSSVAAEFLTALEEEAQHGVIPDYVPTRIRTTFDRYYTPFFKDKKIDTITIVDLDRHHEWRSKYAHTGIDHEEIEYERDGKKVSFKITPKNPSVSTIRKERQHFNKLMEFAARRGYIRHDAIPKHAKIRGAGSTRVAFDQAQMTALQKTSVERCRETKHAIQQRSAIMLHYRMLLLYLTGLRPRESRLLKFSDLVIGPDKSGALSYWISLKPHHLKHAEVRRHQRVVIPQLGMWLVIEGLKKMYKHFDDHDFQKDDYLFHNPDGTLNTNTGKKFQSLLRKAKIVDGNSEKNKEYALGSFRHTFISERLYEQQDIGFVARWAGTSISMIEKHYSHVLNELEHRSPREPNTVALLACDFDVLIGKSDVNLTAEPNLDDILANVPLGPPPRSEIDIFKERMMSSVGEFLKIMDDFHDGEFQSLSDDEMLDEIHQFFGDRELNNEQAKAFLELIR